MGYRIMLTESQYESLLGNINEQKKIKGSFGKTLGKKTLKFGTKKEGYDYVLPTSDEKDKINSLITDNEVDLYVNGDIHEKDREGVKDLNGSYGVYRIKQGNPKYYALIVKTYEWMVAKDLRPTTIVLAKPTKVIDTKQQTIKRQYTGVTSEPIEFPVDGSGKDYFLDNEWLLTDKFKNDFKTQVLDEITRAKQVDPNLKPALTNLNISTSCSTLKNGIPQRSPGAKKYSTTGITFLDLSTERNNAAKNYVLKALGDAGVDVKNVNIVPKVDGDNGDGTSGPQYAGVNPKEFDKYKFLNMKLKFNGLVKPTPQPYDGTDIIPGTSHYVFQATLKSPDEPYKIQVPGLYNKWNSNVPVRKVCKRTKHGISCEEIQNLNGPVNDPWTGLDAYFQPKNVNFNNK